MTNRTITAPTTAWATNARDLARIGADKSPETIVNTLCFSNADMGRGSNPWFRVGAAQVTVEISDDKQLVADAVTSLRSEQQAVRAEAEKRAVDIERQIQSLLAISYDKPVASQINPEQPDDDISGSPF